MHFGGDRQHLLDCCQLLEERKVWGWWGEATLRSLDDVQVLRALERSNCKQVFVGIESIEESALAANNKGFNRVADYKRIIHMAHDHGILIHAGFMWGLDGSTPECFDATARFCDDVGLYLASTNIVAYFPGLPAHDALEREGRILAKDMRDYDSVRVTVEPTGMTTEQVYAGARRFLDRFYSFESIFRRSFSNANYRLAQLWGFIGLNLVYRAYFKVWAKRLGVKDTPWQASPEERDSFPYVGGAMPPIYAVGEAEVRILTFLHKAWDRVPEAASRVRALVPALLVAAVSLLGFGVIRALAAGHWPVPWPSTAAGVGAFAGATAVSTWLVGRLARMQSGRAARIVGVSAALAPMALCVPLLPEHAGLWRFALGWMTATFALKAWSVLATGELRDKSPFRIAAFLLYFPTLDFAGSFRLDPSKSMLTRHLPLMAAGAARFWGGVALACALFWVLFFGFGTGPWLPLALLGRLLVVYLILRGSLEYWTAYWRMAGYVVPRPFGRHSLRPSRPSRLWRSWNRPLHGWLLRHVYVPLGGRERPVTATLATFAVSAALGCALLAPVVSRFPWELALFVGAQGVLVALEKRLAAWTPSPWPARAQTLAMAALLLASAPWLTELIDRIVI